MTHAGSKAGWIETTGLIEQGAVDAINCEDNGIAGVAGVSEGYGGYCHD